MKAHFTAPIVLHIASEGGWHLIEWIYYGGSALLLIVAAGLIIRGRHDRRAHRYPSRRPHAAAAIDAPDDRTEQCGTAIDGTYDVNRAKNGNVNASDVLMESPKLDVVKKA